MDFKKPFTPTQFAPNAIHVSLDLETASTSDNAAIVQLAASAYDDNGHLREFDQYISLMDNERYGREIDRETMDWWDKQDPIVRKRVFGGVVGLDQALDHFHDWCNQISNNDIGRIHLWGNGCDFDNVILRNAYEVFGEYPFNFRQHQHLRTLMYITPAYIQQAAHEDYVASYPQATVHDASCDATYQLYKILAALGHHRVNT